MSHGPLSLTTPVSPNTMVDPDDTLNTKNALRTLGHMQTPHYGITPYPDRPLFDGLKAFQKREGLQIDGIMKPGYETHQRLNLRLAQQATNPPRAIPMADNGGPAPGDNDGGGSDGGSTPPTARPDSSNDEVFENFRRKWIDGKNPPSSPIQDWYGEHGGKLFPPGPFRGGGSVGGVRN